MRNGMGMAVGAARGGFLGLLIALLAVVPLQDMAWAARSKDQPEGLERHSPAGKLFRGMANAATGWMEIPKQISLKWQQAGPMEGVTAGLFRGVGYAVARSTVGGYEIATFPVPVPDGYRPVMEPEFVVPKDESET
ncbi:MAG: hypothetical protein COV76_04900 [Candidatus Omnitrophica bacterium CG11_big_fil_rev_8_21_14_0_20_64_10]|nr:MAG: hypothetical protein COV76_04900 [Candidatus Omnitrophica bacterium CG11_big_fil_rev_8_21_14_0_20_64_10]